MKISFWRFFTKHFLLFIGCAILPLIAIIIVFQYCYYNNCTIEQGSVATIVIGALTYIGTILWGVFIYYKSWVDKEIQEYKNRPIIEAKVLLSHNEMQEFQLYEMSQVKDFLNNSITLCGLGQSNNTDIKYALIKMTNYGISRLSDICVENVIIRKNRRALHQENNSYIVSHGFPKTLSYKDNWEIFVAIDESLIDANENGVPEIIITLKFNNNFVDTYYNIVILQIVENGSYGQRSNVYNEEDYNKTKKNLQPLRRSGLFINNYRNNNIEI